jgi:hypothetical protein
MTGSVRPDQVFSPGGGITREAALAKEAAMIDPGELREGMTVRDLDGHKLGTVANLGATHFELEQGWPPQRDYVVTLHLVARVEGQDIFLHAHPGTYVPPEEEGASQR